jgi:hypothetical protein
MLNGAAKQPAALAWVGMIRAKQQAITIFWYVFMKTPYECCDTDGYFIVWDYTARRVLLQSIVLSKEKGQ